MIQLPPTGPIIEHSECCCVGDQIFNTRAVGVTWGGVLIITVLQIKNTSTTQTMCLSLTRLSLPLQVLKCSSLWLQCIQLQQGWLWPDFASGHFEAHPPEREPKLQVDFDEE